MESESDNKEMYELKHLKASPDVTDSETELLERSDTAIPKVCAKDGTKEEAEEGRGSLKRGINLFDATTMFVGGILGSGIFITPAIILEQTGSFGVSMLCWVFGTFVGIISGLCFVELALLIPRTGGELVYILEGYSFKNRNKWTTFLGGMMAFLYSWTGTTIIRPASLSIIVLTCTKYLIRPIYLGCDIPENLRKCVALSILLLIAVIVLRGVKMMARFNSVVTVCKIFTVIFIFIVGVAGIIRKGGVPDSFRHPFQGTQITSAESVGSIAVALYSVLFAFDGWDGIGFIVEETKKPERTLPRAMVVGMAIVSVSYILVNLAFFSVLSREEIVGTQAVALPFGEKVIGTAGLVVFPLLVAISAFGASVLSMYVGSRALFSASREGLLPEPLCGSHKSWNTPVAGIIFHVGLTSIYLVSGDISALIEGQGAALWLFYALCFVAILIMRRTHKEDKRPFKVWCFIPVVMTVISVFLVLLPLTRGPGWTLASFGLTLTGIPVYIIFVMETPWRIRPLFLDKWSKWVTRQVNRLLSAKSSRPL